MILLLNWHHWLMDEKASVSGASSGGDGKLVWLLLRACWDEISLIGVVGMLIPGTSWFKVYKQFFLLVLLFTRKPAKALFASSFMLFIEYKGGLFIVGDKECEVYPSEEESGELDGEICVGEGRVDRFQSKRLKLCCCCWCCCWCCWLDKGER